MKHENFVYFVLSDRVKNPSYSFTGYTDKETDTLQVVYRGRKEKADGKIVDVAHRYKFDEAHRTLRVHKDETSILPSVSYDDEGNEVITKIKSVDFIRNYPYCKGSKNSSEGAAWDFTEIREEADAMSAIDAKRFKLNAESTALNLEDGDLKEMAAMYGLFNAEPHKMKHFLLEKAGSEPAKFMEKFNSPRRSALALIKKGIAENILTKKGSLITWGDETVGATEDIAVARLMTDKDFSEALRQSIKAKK